MGLDLTSSLSLWGLWVVFLFQPASAMPNCPRGWMVYKTGCFGFFSVRLNWMDAEMQCQTLGSSGHLASFHNREEVEIIAKHINEVNTAGEPVWVGLYDTKKGPSLQNREFKWTDRSPVPYMPWEAGEPNAWKNIEFCGELVKSGEEHF